MIFLIFQLFDLLTAFVLVTAHFDMASWPILFYHSTYLIAKAAWFWKDPFSWIDGLAGVYILLMIFGVKTWLTWFFVGYFLYKLSLFLIYS